MALAEARAAWQRTANRCLVQEDAKRAPKLACCSSSTPSFKHAEPGPTSTDTGLDIPSAGSLPFDQNPSYSNLLSPNTRWWLQMQPNYGYQKVLMDEQFISMEGQIETCQDPLDLESKEELRDEGIFSSEVSKSGGDVYFDSESSWIGAEKNTPWWRTADTEELALLVAQRSVDVLENCDLPKPQNTRVKKHMNKNVCYFSHDEISTSLLVRKTGIGSQQRVCTLDHVQGRSMSGNSCGKLGKSAEDQLVFGADNPLRDSPTYKRTPDQKHTVEEDDASRAQLLEALRHSQTRAREAEEVMKQACAEKEHVVKLVLRQASQIFAYKQWLQLLQLENMYFQYKHGKIQSSFYSPPTISPWSNVGSSKTRKAGREFCSNKKRGKRSRPYRCDVGRFAIVFALGLGLVGAGLLLGWSIGWMLPIW